MATDLMRAPRLSFPARKGDEHPFRRRRSAANRDNGNNTEDRRKSWLRFAGVGLMGKIIGDGARDTWSTTVGKWILMGGLGSLLAMIASLSAIYTEHMHTVKEAIIRAERVQTTLDTLTQGQQKIQAKVDQLSDELKAVEIETARHSSVFDAPLSPSARTR